MRRRTLGILGATVAILLATPAGAFGADLYVDAETGANTNPACPSVSPCATVTYAVSNSSASDSIFIDSGTYNEAVTIGGGRSLEFNDFVAGDGSARAIIDGGTGTAVTVSASGAGVISGLRFYGNTSGITLDGVAEVDDGLFDDPDATSAAGVVVNSGGAGSLVHDSNFSDPAPSTVRGRSGVIVNPNGRAEVRGNTFTDLNLGILAGAPFGGNTLIAQNLITQIHNYPTQGRGIAAQSQLGFGKVILRENVISDASGTSVYGAILFGANVSLVRNQISGQSIGVWVSSDTTDVTLEGDRIWDNTDLGVFLHDTGGGAPKTSAAVTNLTAVGNGTDVVADNSDLALDSSIVAQIGPSGSGACTINYSIGPPAPGPPSPVDTSGCYAFASNSDPLFADPGNGNFHLLAGSPAIDMGNPAAPAPGAVDFDGDARALDGATDCDLTPRRDIGADEFVPPAPLDCTPPQTSIDSGPSDGAAITDPTPAFGFSSEPGATFECSVDGASFGVCSHQSQQILDLTAAPDGAHSFAVRATDAAENTDPTPAQRAFTLDRKAPKTTFTRTPKKKSRKKKAVFRFIADENATYSCRLDTKPAFACAGKAKLKIKPGKHRFGVVATDEAGNTEAAPASYRFKRLEKKK